MKDTTTQAATLADRVATFLFRPVDAAYLAYFRIAFSGAMMWFAFAHLFSGKVTWKYIDPVNHWHYFGFEWVQPWPGIGMYLHFALLGIAAAFMLVGLYYRLAATTFALLMSYVFLLDRAYYLNHHYLMVLLGWMMVILPANRILSFDRLHREQQHPQPDDESAITTVPAWTLWLVRFHIGIPYFFGGIAKLDGDWLNLQPMRLTLSTRNWYPWATQFVDGELLVWLFSWGGMLFDLLIVPALLWKRTRIVALVITTLFHLTNAFVFPIGIFPWLMIAATFVFLPPDFPRSLPGVFRKTTGKADQAVKLTWQSLNTRRRAIAFALLALVLVHTALPFRYLLLPGSPNWTERGHCFAWHMMLRSKYGGVRLYVTDRRTGETGIADLRKHVAFAQMMRVARDPENIRQLAHKVADYYREHGRPDVEVRALSLVSLNGRKPQLMIDPKVDLAAEPRTLATPSWILPLTEPLRKNHWEVPLVQWDQELGIDPESLLGVPLNLSARKVAQREVANSMDDADEEFTR